MKAERWNQITEIFESALRRDAPERPAFLAGTCASDDELRREVEAMIVSHDLQNHDSGSKLTQSITS
jgi:hypothetical protein